MHARSQRFPLLDSLRAIAAVSVLVVHASAYAPIPDVLRPYAARLDLGVAVFYTLGGIFQARSLCVEVTFYAFLPLYALALRGLPQQTGRRLWAGELAGLVTIFIAAVAYKAWVLRDHEELPRWRAPASLAALIS